MRLIKPDSEGKIICPQCKRRYKPDLEIPADSDTRAIQNIYPNAEPYQREQLMTGLCSDRCFDLYIGAPKGRYDSNGKSVSGGWRAAAGEKPWAK